jgi:hypothetical protein
MPRLHIKLQGFVCEFGGEGFEKQEETSGKNRIIWQEEFRGFIFLHNTQKLSNLVKFKN